MGWNVILEILRTGIAGVAFLLAMFAYRLLRRAFFDSEVDWIEARKAVREYMVFSVVLALIVVAWEWIVLDAKTLRQSVATLQSTNSTLHQQVNDAQNHVQDLQKNLERSSDSKSKLKSDVDTLLRVQRAYISFCNDVALNSRLTSEDARVFLSEHCAPTPE